MLFGIYYILLSSFVINFFFGHYFGKKGVFFLTSFFTTLSFLIVLYTFITRINFVVPELISGGVWVSVLNFSVKWNFLFDSLSIIMLLVILGISSLVHVYSIYYMYHDPYCSKFMCYLTAFTLFMVILVTSSNFLMLFLGWEGVGLCSFLLISFWSTRVQANKAALKAMLINRVGDYFLICGFILIFIVFKSVDFYVIFSKVHVYIYKIVLSSKFFTLTVIDVICFFLMVGAITKSAQLGLHGWLPDAMEAPTPVSALIHAATMVTAGVFLIIRCSYLFEFSPLCLKFLTYIGAFSIIVFGCIGLAQYDIKKIIAYSTCSQLGYMILACGLSGYNFALFHLFNHAGFKALLFLSAGSIIHTMNNEQDIRRLNAINSITPLTSVCFTIGSLSLIGIPFFSGFYSKDSIISLSSFYTNNFFIYISTLFGVILTTAYSFRLFYYLFIKENFNSSFNNRNFLKNYDFNYFNFIPLIILTFLSVASGYLGKTLFIGIGTNFFFGSIFSLNKNIFYIEFIDFKLKILPLLFIVLTIVFIFFYYKTYKKYYIDYNTFLLFNKRFFIDSLLNLFIAFIFHRNSFKIYFLFDKGLLEFFGPTGLSYVVDKIYEFFSEEIHNGDIGTYTKFSVFTLLSVMIFFLVVAI